MDLLEEKENKCIIVTGETGFVVAIELAKRVASEIDVELGTIVGYNVRFDRIYDETTKLIFMTTGVFLHEVISDIKNDKYYIIIIDKAHERRINIDMLISLVYYPLKNTDNLKIIIMSATLDAAKFQKIFDKSPLLSIPGFTYPIGIIYDNECPDDEQSANGIHEILEKIAELIVQIHFNNTNGDILVFLPGKEDILNTEKYIEYPVPLRKLLSTLENLIHYGCLEDDQQITELGKISQKFPVKPCLAKILFESYQYNCTDSIFKIVSMLESP
ncbi:hypothetical protein HCN44_000811 [Aphidius gifuensis]|uniref:Helicase ATP-binding domain-containing protein n=1 Tax=Aphidius gifuensis TaxID=684658 RepID=A0A834XUG5_APHGI|nr:hypothetical protein HCN44_000811 [Aphidius gifuensis]